MSERLSGIGLCLEGLVPSIFEKAVNLLNFIVKNHSFTDGKKRIAAGLFA